MMEHGYYGNCISAHSIAPISVSVATEHHTEETLFFFFTMQALIGNCANPGK